MKLSQYLRGIVLLAVITAVLPVSGQMKGTLRDSIMPEKKPSLKFLARFHQGKVELRWYPTSAAIWRLANSKGYQLERVELAENGSGDFQKIGRGIFKPYTAAEWKQNIPVENDYVQAVKEANAAVSKSGKTLDEQLNARNDESGIFLTWLLGVNFNKDAAEGAGVAFRDGNIQAGKAYAYRLFIPGQNMIDTALLIVDNTSVEDIMAAPVGFRTEQEEGAVKLLWEFGDNREHFTGYQVERSADGGKTFTRLTKHPLMITAKATEEISFTDSVKNYVRYQYRIIGLTPFGDESIPTPAEWAMGIDKTPATAPANTRAKGDRNKIVITWELPYQSSDLAGFIVARGKSPEGPFFPFQENKLLVNDRLALDNKPSPKEPYYVVFAVDTAGNRSSTFAILASVYDSVAPKRPLGLTGSIDSAGAIKLAWKRNNDNDLAGYHVYAANGKNNVYRQLTGYAVEDSVFVDTVTMRSLNKNVYYKITAVDYNNNPSEYSEILILKRPDIIAPAAPVINSYNVQDNKVNLTWIKSSSNDVVKHQLVKAAANGKKETIELKSGDSYTDAAVEEGKTYSYTVVAIDESGLQTASKPMAITIAENSVKPGVNGFTARWDDKAKKAMLQWSINAKERFELVLFRSSADGELKAYKKLPGDSRSFNDEPGSGKYQYAVKVIYLNGAESELSQPVVVEAK